MAVTTEVIRGGRNETTYTIMMTKNMMLIFRVCFSRAESVAFSFRGNLFFGCCDMMYGGTLFVFFENCFCCRWFGKIALFKVESFVYSFYHRYVQTKCADYIDNGPKT